jgi:NTP pyrophosphatase (non-canonical NTP hydrolase)
VNLNDYQLAARATANYPRNQYAVIYPALGLAGETGEVVEKIKKVVRKAGGPVGPWDAAELADFRNEIKKELGDVMWYVASLADDLGITLEDIAKTNLAKLADRNARGVIKGEGDNR